MTPAFRRAAGMHRRNRTRGYRGLRRMPPPPLPGAPAVGAVATAAVLAAAGASSPASAAPLSFSVSTGMPSPDGNVTGSPHRDPTVLNGDDYECTLTTPQMTAADGSEAGNVRLHTRPGRLFLDVNQGGTPGHWNDAYLIAGVNPPGYDSTRCDGWGYGTSYRFPVPASEAGPLHVGIIRMRTVSGFEGDAGFDLWLTAGKGNAQSGAPWDSGHVTVTDMQSSEQTTEIMVWLNSPGIWRSQYASLGWVTIGTRTWQVLYYTGHSARHPWNYIVFASPKATSRATVTTDRNLDLQPLIRFAAEHGWVTAGADLQAVDAGFEWYANPTGGTQVSAYSLTGVR